MNEHGNKVKKESARRKAEICRASLMTQQYVLLKPPPWRRGKFYGFNMVNVGVAAIIMIVNTLRT